MHAAGQVNVWHWLIVLAIVLAVFHFGPRPPFR
jgi:hypothetical protein